MKLLTKKEEHQVSGNGKNNETRKTWGPGSTDSDATQ